MEKNKKYIDRNNALRYMGCGGDVPSSLSGIIDDCENELCKVMRPRSIYAVRSIEELSDILVGRDIREHLDGCEKAVLLAVTLGTGVDAEIRKNQSLEVTRALVLDAEASAAAEAYCDEVEQKIAESFGYRTWRYSPGYGDFPLEVQERLLDSLDAGRKIGLYLSQGNMLSPSKSITAVIGVSSKPLNQSRKSCAVCRLAPRCAYRKEGTHCGS